MRRTRGNNDVKLTSRRAQMFEVTADSRKTSDYQQTAAWQTVDLVWGGGPGSREQEVQ